MPTFDDPTLITKEQLVSCGLIEELTYVHPTQFEMSDKEILDLMTAKMNERKEVLLLLFSLFCLLKQVVFDDGQIIV